VSWCYPEFILGIPWYELAGILDVSWGYPDDFGLADNLLFTNHRCSGESTFWGKLPPGDPPRGRPQGNPPGDPSGDPLGSPQGGSPGDHPGDHPNHLPKSSPRWSPNSLADIPPDSRAGSPQTAPDHVPYHPPYPRGSSPGEFSLGVLFVLMRPPAAPAHPPPREHNNPPKRNPNGLTSSDGESESIKKTQNVNQTFRRLVRARRIA
jgi:hypothetical protein